MPVAPHTVSAPSVPRRKGERTAERVLDAAEDLFAERGYAGTTLRDVAERAGLRTPSLYNHFPSKDSLYAAVLERGIGPVLAALSGFAEGGRAARLDSRQIVTETMGVLARHPNLPRLVLHETLSGGQRLTPMLRGWFTSVFARAREVIESNPAAGRWAPEQLPLLVLAMYHVVVGYFTTAPLFQELGGEDPLTEGALIRQTHFLRQLVALLLPETAGADG